jgi:hypothetical protein
MHVMIEKAHAAWTGFTSNNRAHCAESVFASSPQQHSPLMRASLYRLAEFLGAAILPGVLPVKVRIQYATLSTMRPAGLNNPAASWLHCSSTGNSIEITIIVDIDQIGQFLRSASSEGMEVYYAAMLILHELGHLFHFDSLFPQNGHAADATGDQESEAWLFATTFAGLWLADAAKSKKDLGNGVTLPPAWQLLGWKFVP